MFAPPQRGSAWLVPGLAVLLVAAIALSFGIPRLMHSSTHTNRLIHEKSPYLLQHARNPVDWYPWGDEAFEKARRENKPIFLSIGYSTCHWCHVMEHESFEDDSVAELLNRWFVAVKVDREERPDVDRVYMTAMQAMGSGGGWPLNVFLTPGLEPFFGGTYFPPTTRQGRIGMTDLLPKIHEAWTQKRQEIEAHGARVFEALGDRDSTETGTVPREPLLQSAYHTLAAIADREHGGFGGAPKFPSPSNLSFLARYALRSPADAATARAIAQEQLDAMRRGGIHDHLGGGFHRYATDSTWLVPHFEKMLYDQAQLVWAYLDAWQVSHPAEDRDAATGILRYVARDLTSPQGAFYSAEDADSEGEEGKFYVWTPDEIEAIAGKEDAAVFGYRYGVTPGGNFEHGTTILNEEHSIEETAQRFGLGADAARTALERTRKKLFDAREKRVRPHRDDKVLTAWNGLMISAYARAARVLGEPEWSERATRAADFLWSELRDSKTGALRRRWRDGEAASAGQLDDHANLALGLIDLYETTFEPRHLERAVAITEAMVTRFWDERDGGMFSSPPDDPHLTLRMKDDYDGAEVAGASTAAWVLVTLGRLLDRNDWKEKSTRMLDRYAHRLERNAAAMPQMLVAMDLETSPVRHVVVAGDSKSPATRALIHEFQSRFLPHDLLLVVDDASRKSIAKMAPFAASLEPRDGKPAAYVCVDYACKLPVTEPAAFAAQLDESAAVAVKGAR